MEANQNNDEKAINEVCDKIMNNLTPQFQIYQNNILQIIEQNLSKYDKVINEQLNIYTNKIKNQLINDNDDELRKKIINFQNINSPILINLSNLNNTNYLINLILLCLSNFDSLTKYFLKPDNEEQILFRAKQNPTGIFLCPSYLKLLDHLWKGTKKVYEPSEIHEKLKILMQNDYYSTNPGIIINSIVNQLHKELILNNNIINQPEWNYNVQNALQNYANYFNGIFNKISNLFFSTIRIRKTTSQNIPIFLFQSTVVFNLYLNNINAQFMPLEQNFQNLYFDINDRNYYCMNDEILNEKTIISIPQILIININRNNNQKQYLNYSQILNNNNFLENNGQQPGIYELYCVIISKYENNANIFYAYIKNVINHKWYLYNKEGIKEVNNDKEVIDMENASLLIYQIQKIQ